MFGLAYRATQAFGVLFLENSQFQLFYLPVPQYSAIASRPQLTILPIFNRVCCTFKQTFPITLLDFSPSLCCTLGGSFCLSTRQDPEIKAEFRSVHHYLIDCINSQLMITNSTHVEAAHGSENQSQNF